MSTTRSTPVTSPGCRTGTWWRSSRSRSPTPARSSIASLEHEDHAYAPGKWSIKEVAGHLADAERVLSYRTLRIGRADTTELPGFDEDAYVSAASFGRRSLEDLMRELRAVRQASVALFDGFGEEAWTRRGIANGAPVSVRALACIIAGHELHHRAILEERYLGGEPWGLGRT